MYNSEIKNEYLSENRNNYNNIMNAFCKSEKYEKLIGKDLYEFTLQDIADMVSYFGSSSGATILNNLYIYANYYSWCAGKSLVITNTNNFLIMKDSAHSLISKKRDSKYVSYEDLLIKLDKLDNDMTKFIALAFFSGLTKEDIMLFKYSDIDGNIANLSSGRKFEMSERLLRYAKGSYNANKFIYRQKNPGKLNLDQFVVHRSKEFNPGEEEKTFNRIIRSKYAYETFGEECLQTKNLQISGCIHFLRELAKEQFPQKFENKEMTYSDYIELSNKFFDKILEHFPGIASNKTYFIKYNFEFLNR